jgi:hypothetical protein
VPDNSDVDTIPREPREMDGDPDRFMFGFKPGDRAVVKLMSDNTIQVKGTQKYLQAVHGGAPSDWAFTLPYLGVIGTPFFFKDFDDTGKPIEDACIEYLEMSRRTPIWQRPPAFNAAREADWVTGVNCGCYLFDTDKDDNVLHIRIPPGKFPEGTHFDRVGKPVHGEVLNVLSRIDKTTYVRGPETL